MGEHHALPPEGIPPEDCGLPAGDASMLYACRYPTLTGFCKMLIDGDSRKLLGAHYVGFGVKNAFQYLDYLIRRPEGITIDEMGELKVRTCVGGTLVELAAVQGKVGEFIRWAGAVGFDAVEVSEGSIELGREVKRALIEALAKDFCVLAEVGSKDPEAPVRAQTWVAQMRSDLEAGASFVVAEGRESGTVGLYGPDGSIREPLVQALVAGVPADRLIFEAPDRAHHKWFVRHLGIEVNLGNVAPDDVIGLETLRRGLRADTAGLAVTALGILGIGRDAGGMC